MAPGTRSNFGAPMFETEVFWKKMSWIEESCLLATLLGIFSGPAVNRRPHSDSAPGLLCGGHKMAPHINKWSPLDGAHD